VALGFLIASFVAHNSNIWQHLAAGRLLARGEYHFGVDPFAYTTEGLYWANHAWLFDLGAYWVYELLGGVVLVVLKALLVAALAAVMLTVRRSGAGLAVPAACTAVALVAMSPRLLLQPSTVSGLLLGITLALLWQPHAEDVGGWRPDNTVALLLVFLLWVNVDGWFFLGPVLVGLFWLGERLGGPRRTPAWLALAGLAVCLLNPHHYRAFTLPAEFASWLGSTQLGQDPRFARLFESPWQIGVRWAPAAAVNLAEWAYFLLVVLGVVSFVLRPAAVRGWRLPVWLAFAALGAARARAIPFFAVVAAPVAALNIQDFVAARAAAPAVGRAARWGLLGALAGLIVLTLAGWLHGFRPDGRRVGWGVRVDASLERAAGTLVRMRAHGRLGPQDRVFNLHPDVAHVGAWFCQWEKFFFDSRLVLFPPVVAEYEMVCRNLDPELAAQQPGSAPVPEEADGLLAKYGVKYLIVYDPSPERQLTAMTALARRPGPWSLHHIDGQVALYARGGAATTDFQAHAERVALAPLGAHLGEFPVPPERGPGHGPREPSWWGDLLRAEPPATWESAAASALLRTYEDRAQADVDKSSRRSGLSFVAGLLGQPALANLAATPCAALSRIRFASAFQPDADERSPALPLLAVRSARAALAANPDDAAAWLRLGQAYVALRGTTEGPAGENSLPPLLTLRQIQIANALENAVRAAPDLLAAHQQLALLYREQHCLDAALEHFRAALDLGRRAGRLGGESADAFATRMARLERQVVELDRRVLDAQNQFAAQVPQLGDNVLGKAGLALRLGLARQALDNVLLKARYPQFGSEGARLELELLLRLGRAGQARAILEDSDIKEIRDRLGETFVAGSALHRYPAYQWLAACAAAAQGDYEQAGGDLAEILTLLEGETGRGLRILPRALAERLAAEVGFRAEPRSLLGQIPVQVQRVDMTRLLALIGRRLLARADLEVVAGVLQLEFGRPDVAEEHLQSGVRLAVGLDTSGRNPAPGRALALAWLRRLQAARKTTDPTRGGR
jgi:hypothetical protein